MRLEELRGFICQQILNAFDNKPVALPTFDRGVLPGTGRIELYTEAYASHHHQNPEAAVQPYVQAAARAQNTY